MSPAAAATAMAASATGARYKLPDARMTPPKPWYSQDSIALSSSYPPPSMASSSSAIRWGGGAQWQRLLRGKCLPSRRPDGADQQQRQQQQRRRGERVDNSTTVVGRGRESGHGGDAPPVGVSAAAAMRSWAAGGSFSVSSSSSSAAAAAAAPRRFSSSRMSTDGDVNNSRRRGVLQSQRQMGGGGGNRHGEEFAKVAAMAGGELADVSTTVKSDFIAAGALASSAASAPTARSELRKGVVEDSTEENGGKDDSIAMADESTRGTLTCSTSVVQPAAPSSSFLRLPPSSLQYEMGVLGGISDKTAPSSSSSSSSSSEEEEEVEDSPYDPASSSGKQPLSAMGYLKKILTSRVYDVAIETPLEPAPKLSERIGTPIFLKREDYQQVFSFKLRGAYNMMASLTKEQLQNGVIASSAGNHAQGVALAAKKLGCEAVICMPVTTPAIKWQSVKALGATVVLVGDSYDETQAYAQAQARRERRTFIHPFDHPDVIAGQGTTGMEILRQHPGPLHAIFVPVGGGGLIAGVAAYVKRVRPEIRIIGVEPVDANAMALSMYMGQRVALEYVGGFADGVAVKMVGEETFRLCRELVDGIVLVTKDAICAAIKDVFEETRTILEPAGALALAGLKAYCKQYELVGESVVAITSGANMNFDRLRLVAQLADVGERKEAVLATQIPERPGSFKEFCQLVGTELNITEFKYRCSDRDIAHIMYSVEPVGSNDLGSLIRRLEEAGLKTVDLTNNDLAKTHLRHLVGGSVDVPNEILYRFEFPEKPGALMKFLDMVSPRWNISLFHYRAVGEERGHVLVGVQVAPEDEERFSMAATNLGYRFTDERNNEAFHMFVRCNHRT